MDAKKFPQSSSSKPSAISNETQPIPKNDQEPKATYGHKRQREWAKITYDCPTSRELVLKKMKTDSMTNKPSYLSMESSTSSTSTWRLLQEFYAKIGRPHQLAVTSAPPPLNSVPSAATSNKFFGVEDFFGVSSAPKTTPSIGASGSANVINLEDEEAEDASGLDLDLKL